MARTDTLGHFLTDVADAIRTKKGTSDTMQASDFDTEIENLPSGGKYAPRYVCFYYYNGTELDDELANLNTSNITSMKYMFYNCFNLTSIDLTDWDTSKVTTMEQMFYNCQQLVSIDGLSNLNLGSLTSLARFAANSSVQSINIDVNNTGTIDVQSMFEGDRSLISATISNLKNITAINSMFSQCANLETVNMTSCTLSSNCRYLTGMFYNCSSLTTLDLSWIIASQQFYSTDNMFNGCVNLRHIDIRNWEINSSTSSNMFGNTASNGVPDDCEIIVKSDTEKTWVTSRFSRLTNVKTVAEYEAEQNQ